MEEKFKPINFNSKKLYIALFTTICLYILRVCMLGVFEDRIRNEMLSEVIVYTIFILVLFIIERKYFINKVKSLKKDIKNKLINVIIVVLVLLVAEYLLNMLFIKIVDTNPTGQNNIINLYNEQPVLTLIYLFVLVPILETIFYYLPYKKIKNKKVALFFSSFIFALFHMITIGSLLELLFIIPYILMSIAFGYGMYKTDNVYVSMITHAINNIAAIVLLLV